MIAMVSAIRWPGISSADRLEVDERRVVDPQPERLVGAVADGVGGVLAARALDRGVGPARARPQEPRQLGHDRPVGHLVEALVDDPQALLDLVHAEQVAGQAVALGAGRDVEVELRDRRCTGAPGGRRTARPSRAGSGRSCTIRSAVAVSIVPRPRIRRTKISFSLSRRVAGLDLLGRLRLIQSPRRLMNSWFRSPLTPPIRK